MTPLTFVAKLEARPGREQEVYAAHRELRDIFQGEKVRA